MLVVIHLGDELGRLRKKMRSYRWKKQPLARLRSRKALRCNRMCLENSDGRTKMRMKVHYRSLADRQ